MKKTTDRIDINNIKDPKFLKTLSYEQLDLLCKDLRNTVINEVSVTGGHLSSNLGIVELTVALHRVFDFSKDKLIFDVGHQCYIHKLLTGRSLKHLGEENAVSGFQKRSESIYDPYEAGHSSTSLSAAEGFAIARDANRENYDIVALIGDASIVNGLSFEALNDISSKNHKVIIVLNDNDMSISQPSGALSNYFRSIGSSSFYNKVKVSYKNSLSKNKFGNWIYKVSTSIKNGLKRLLVHTSSIFENLGFTYIGPVDGHNIKALEKALKRSKNTTKSVIVHVRTIKGKGYSYSENDKEGYWHGVTPFNIETGKPLNYHEGLISWSHYYSDLTNKILSDHKDGYLIVPATLKGSGLEQCFKNYPDRCNDVGIAEEHALTLSGALALNGLHPIVSIYSTFLQRSYDEISHDCARFNSNMTILIDRAGLTGSNGETHQGIFDVAYLRTIPNVVVTMPTNKEEGYSLYEESFNNHGIFAIRYPRDYVCSNVDFKLKKYPFGQFIFEKDVDDKNVCIVGVGPNGRYLLNKINENKVQCGFVLALYLNPISEKDIEKLSKYKNIIIYDSYGVKEGFCEGLESKLLESGYKGTIINRCLPSSFIKQGKVKDQLASFGLDVDSIFNILNSIK